MNKTTLLKEYWTLTKPGIIFGNAVTAIAGFALASKGNINVILFLAMLLGLSLVIASACVWNNYFDRAMDEKMARTKNRALVKGVISIENALLFGMILGLVGLSVLFIFTNVLTVAMAACGFFTYVVLYGYSKYKTSFGTVIGSISGAIPPVVGYTAVSNCIDLGALILFSIVVAWQMPHFYAIAMFRLDDYSKASIPVLPVSSGMLTAKVHSLLWVLAFGAASMLLTFTGYTGYTYLAVTTVLSRAWLTLSLKGFTTTNDQVWARKMFMLSLFIIMAQAITICLDCR
ncbi:MAG: heme o synthase [Chlamydiales bacterium]|nr:heme o synthase [Chlamydiales bacterium]